MRKLLVGLWVTLCAAAAWAQQGYPARPVSIIVPFAAGGPTDRVGRDLAEALGKALGGRVVVENIGGGGGVIGTARVAKAQPDGYTLLLHHVSMATMPTLVRQLGFNVESDFEYLGMVSEVPMVLIGRPTQKAKTYPELAAWIQANRGRVSLGNAGTGSASHLCGLLLQHALQVEMRSEPYKGTALAMGDLAAGRLDLMCDQTTHAAPEVQKKHVLAYAVTSNTRLQTPGLAGLPTLQEMGLAGFEINIWHGLYAPKGTPPELAGRINAALQQALKDPVFVRRQKELGAVVVTDARVNPAQHKKFVQAEIAKWSPIIRAAGEYVD